MKIAKAHWTHEDEPDVHYSLIVATEKEFNETPAFKLKVYGIPGVINQANKYEVWPLPTRSGRVNATYEVPVMGKMNPAACIRQRFC